MLVKLDLHIHSCLSACANADNTPCNIVNLAKLIDEKVIAVADHNCVLNYPAADKCGKSQDILVIPAMEVTTAEEIHALCLFPDYDSALSVQKEIHSTMARYKIDERIYNRQYIRADYDEIKGEVDFLLQVACGYGIYDLCALVSGVGGLVIPAHIDKDSYSLLAVLGEVPPDLPVSALEITPNCPTEIRKKYANYMLIESSDAHSLEKMCSQEFAIDLPEVSISALFEYLAGGKK